MERTTLLFAVEESKRPAGTNMMKFRQGTQKDSPTEYVYKELSGDALSRNVFKKEMTSAIRILIQQSCILW